ncbi:MAG: hypothetical protein J6P03_05140 [Opitutales bacterium]|nr:hypothetical protein [Opitutales bacterium]
MGCFRKFLVIFYAVSAAYFAALAFWQKKAPRQNGGEGKFLRWGGEAFSAAAREGRLVFFRVPSFKDPVKSGDALAVLEKNYIQTELDPAAFPADYKALRKIYERSGADGAVNIGIVSPRGAPIFLANRFSGNPDSFSSELHSLSGAAKAFRDMGEDFRRHARAAISVEHKMNEFSGVPYLFFNAGGLSEFPRFRLLFSRAAAGGVPAAVLAENSRIVARKLFLEKRELPVDTVLLAFACARDSYAREADGMSKLLLLRAMSEFAFIDDTDYFRPHFLSEAEKCLDLQGGDGLFRFEPSGGKAAARLGENSLMLSILSRAYMISGSARFANARESLARALDAAADKAGAVPAILSAEVPSEAEAAQVALLARGFLDAYFSSANESHLKTALKYFDKLDSLYGGEASDGWFANSSRSVFAQTLRYLDRVDNVLPSANGEGAQLLADFSMIRPGFAPRLATLLNAHSNFLSINNFDSASFKLAMLSNPMRMRFQSKMYALPQKDSKSEEK